MRPEIRFIEVGILTEPEPIERPNVRLRNSARMLPKRHEIDEDTIDTLRILINQVHSHLVDFKGGRNYSMPVELPEYVRKLGLRRTKQFMRELWKRVQAECLPSGDNKAEFQVYRMIFEELGTNLDTLRQKGYKKHYVGRLRRR